MEKRYGQHTQWVVCNIPGKELKEGRVDYDRIPSRVYLRFRKPRYFYDDGDIAPIGQDCAVSGKLAIDFFQSNFLS